MPNRFESWQFWSATKKLLGESRLMMILGRRNGRTIRMYSADPKYTVERCLDPLQHLHAIFSELNLFGRGDVAGLAIKYLQTAVDDQALPDHVSNLLPTIESEILADYQAVAALQAGISDGIDADQASDLATEAKYEIDRTLSKYLQDLK